MKKFAEDKLKSINSAYQFLTSPEANAKRPTPSRPSPPESEPQTRQSNTRKERQEKQEEGKSHRESNSSRPTSPIEMVYVKGGTFTMGYTSENESCLLKWFKCLSGDWYPDEEPAHRVAVSDFQLGRYEVTQTQWRAVMESNPSYFKGDNLPVERVSWNDAQEFIRRLNGQTGRRYRLPTEVEWEYAARGGSKSNGYKYCGSNAVDDVAWYKYNAGSRTHPVGTKAASELGLYDMSGNV
jgi:formylglycine-generating enzyme required for sulfatase activity